MTCIHFCIFVYVFVFEEAVIRVVPGKKSLNHIRNI